MAVIYDSAAESHTGTTGSASQASFSWNHAPVSGSQAILVFVVNLVTSNYIATSVQFNPSVENLNVPEIVAARAQDTAGEPGAVQTFFLDNVTWNVSKVIQVNRTNNTDELWAVSIALRGRTTIPFEVYEAGIQKHEGDGTLAEVSVNDGSPGTNSTRFAAIHSGLAAFPPAGANSTAVHNFDTGNQTAAVVVETTAGQGSRSVGFSSGTSEDRAAVYLAVREFEAPPAEPRNPNHLNPYVVQIQAIQRASNF